MLRLQQAEDHVTPGVDVVDDEQELAKAGLPEIFGQQLDVFAGQFETRRRAQRGRAANEVPEFGGAAVE